MSTDEELVSAQYDAARIATRSEIRDVRLLSSQVSLEKLPSLGQAMIYGMDLDTTVEHDEGDDTFVVRNKCSVDISAQADEESEETHSEGDNSALRVATIQFEHAALYSLSLRESDTPPKPEELQAFAKTTGQFALYPYAREYIYDVTGRLALPPLTVGLLRLPTAPPHRAE